MAVRADGSRQRVRRPSPSRRRLLRVPARPSSHRCTGHSRRGASRIPYPPQILARSCPRRRANRGASPRGPGVAVGRARRGGGRGGVLAARRCPANWPRRSGRWRPTTPGSASWRSRQRRSVESRGRDGLTSGRGRRAAECVPGRRGRFHWYGLGRRPSGRRWHRPDHQLPRDRRGLQRGQAHRRDRSQEGALHRDREEGRQGAGSRVAARIADVPGARGGEDGAARANRSWCSANRSVSKTR